MSEKLLKNCIFGIVSTIVLSIVLTLLSCWILYSRDDGENIIGIFSLSVPFVSCFFGAYISSSKNKESGILCGLLTGSFFSLISLILSCVFGNGITLKEIVVISLILLISSVSGYLGLPKKKRQGKKKRNTKRH